MFGCGVRQSNCTVVRLTGRSKREVTVESIISVHVLHFMERGAASGTVGGRYSISGSRGMSLTAR